MAYIYTRAADAGVGAARAQRRVADFLQDPQQLDVAFGVGSSPGLNAARLIERKGRSLKKLFGHAHIFVDARPADAGVDPRRRRGIHRGQPKRGGRCHARGRAK